MLVLKKLCKYINTVHESHELYLNVFSTVFCSTFKPILIHNTQNLLGCFRLQMMKKSKKKYHFKSQQFFVVYATSQSGIYHPVTSWCGLRFVHNTFILSHLKSSFAYIIFVLIFDFKRHTISQNKNNYFWLDCALCRFKSFS